MMELAIGVGYALILLLVIVVAYVVIKFATYTLAVVATFVAFQWVFTSLAFLPITENSSWYHVSGMFAFYILTIVAMCRDAYDLPKRAEKIKNDLAS